MIKRLRISTLVVTAIAFTVYAALIAWFVQLDADIALRNGFLCNFLYYAYRFVNIAVFFWAYATTIYTVYLGGWEKALPLMGIYAGMVAYKYALNFVFGSITDGTFPSFSLFVREDLPIIGGEFLLEMIQYAIVCLTIALCLRSWRSAVQTGRVDADHTIRTMFSWKNPLQRAALFVGVVQATLGILQHLFYQFVRLVYEMEPEGWMIITVDLVSDVLVGFVGYFVMLLLLQGFVNWKEKVKAKEMTV